MTFLELLKKDKDCLYLYNISYNIYGIETDLFPDKYIIVTQDNWRIPDDYADKVKHMYSHYEIIITEENSKFIVYNTSQWFNMVLNNEIICWICACLNKKFVIKEHVKLILKTDPLKLRKNFDAQLDPSVLYALNKLSSSENQDVLIGKEVLWETIRDVIFSLQIIDNHKIVRFKEANKAWFDIINTTTEDETNRAWLNHLTGPLKTFKSNTEQLVRNDKLNKILKNE